jgi:hypothetical protein
MVPTGMLLYGEPREMYLRLHKENLKNFQSPQRRQEYDSAPMSGRLPGEILGVDDPTGYNVNYVGRGAAKSHAD